MVKNEAHISIRFNAVERSRVPRLRHGGGVPILAGPQPRHQRRVAPAKRPRSPVSGARLR